MQYELRTYQEKSKNAILAEWDSGIKKTLLVLPTGTGKTIVFASVAEELVRRGEQVLILAHRKELLDQAADKIAKATGLFCAVEKGEQKAADSWYRIVVASVQTLMREDRQAAFTPDYFSTIIVDEAHHVLSDSYRKILAYFSGARVLGVTATPDRGDMRNLGEIFESVAYQYSLPQAIMDGYLCKLRALTIPITIDLAGVAQQAGDYKLSDVDCALMPYLNAIAGEVKTHCSDRKTVIFLPLIATSQKMCELLKTQGIAAREINGESVDRAETLQWFSKAEKGSVLCNSMLLTEGWDEPSADCIVCLRPTKIRSLYAQIVGRGTRICPGKDNLLILDFLWITNRHSLCKPANLICENQELADKVTEILAREENANGCDLELAANQGAGEVVEEREKSLAQKLAEHRHRKRALVDPLQYEYSIKAEDLIDYQPAMASEMAPPSDSQKKLLEKAGIYPDEIPNAGFASKLIERIERRKTEGLSTPKQIRKLEFYGFRGVGLWPFDEAQRVINRIAANSWRVPPQIKPGEYRPIKR